MTLGFPYYIIPCFARRIDASESSYHHFLKDEISQSPGFPQPKDFIDFRIFTTYRKSSFVVRLISAVV